MIKEARSLLRDLAGALVQTLSPRPLSPRGLRPGDRQQVDHVPGAAARRPQRVRVVCRAGPKALLCVRLPHPLPGRRPHLVVLGPHVRAAAARGYPANSLRTWPTPLLTLLCV